MATKIQLRRDTAADWTSGNPTLAAGEFAWESDTNRYKIGDGSTAWTSLAYADTLSTLGDLSVTGSTISSPSNADLTLTTSGTGDIVLDALRVNGTTLDSSDSSKITIAEALDVTGAFTSANVAITGGTITGITDLVVADGGTGASTLTDNSVLTGTGASAISAENNLTFNGSTLGVTGNITASTTIAATTDITAGGDISSEGIQLVDNKISASRTNDTLFLAPAGTGLVNIGNSDFAADVGGLSYGGYGSGHERGNVLTYADLTHTPGSDRQYANWINGSWKTDGADTTSSNGRYRGLIVEAAVDLNGSSITHSSKSRGIQGLNAESLIQNTSADLGTISTVTGFIGYFYVVPWAGSVAVTDCIGCSASGDIDAGYLGGSNSITVTNATAFRSPGMSHYGASGSVTTAVTNSYEFYASGISNATNPWVFYDATTAGGNGNSRLGAIQLYRQSSAPSGVAEAAHIYALDDSASAEVYVKDEAGNATKISPHNEKGEWEYYSKNTVTGKTVRVNMEKMIRKLEEFTGESFIKTI